MYRLKLFGGATIEGPDGPLTGRAVQRRRLALLALLAVSRGRGLSRDRLVAFLWPDSDAERARHLLSDSVYRINQALGGEAITGAGDDLRISPNRLSSDAWEFLEAIDEQDWARASGLYAAPLLDGFFVPGSGEFERWADSERERFRRERARALEALAQVADDRSDPAAAVDCWRTLATDDPYSSRIALRYMRALERAGDRAAAVQHARIHAVLVRDDLGVEPDPEVLRFAERLRLPAGAGEMQSEAAAAALPPIAPAGVSGALESRVPVPDDTLRAEPTGATGGVTRAKVLREDASSAARESRSRRSRMRRGAVAAAAMLVVVLAIATRNQNRAVGPLGEPASIAVLPFDDLSVDRDQEYFADGITEELLMRLSRIEGLAVVGRTSSFAFKGKNLDARDVADRLGVKFVLGGSVLRSGDRLRIFAQLIDATSGYQLWSDRYERQQEDVFTIQDEIARAIVTRLRGRLAGAGVTGDPGAASIDPEGYNLYLRGRFEWHKRTQQGLLDAARFFSQAAERERGYARAHAGLGDAYAVLGFYDYLPPREAFPNAKEEARIALSLDATLAEPHATLGYVALYHDWEWERAESEFRRSIELDPSYSTGHQWYANFLTAMGRFDEAVREMRAAQDLDPLSLIANAALGWVLYYAGDFQGAIDQLGRTLELNPQFELAYLWRGLAHEELEHTEAALDDLHRAVTQSNGSAISRAALARALARSGARDQALDLLRDLEADEPQHYVPAYEIAKVHEALDDPAGARRWLDRALEQRSHSMVFLAVDPQLRRLRESPATGDLLRAVGLVPARPSRER